MNTKLIMTCSMAACMTLGSAAMPTKEEVERAEPIVQKLLASERAAFESGKMTRSEVAVEAMKLAKLADTDAAKLLLMKGAFVLYVKDGQLEKAVETMNALETAISDMPPQSVTNMVETALLEMSKKEDGARLYRLLDMSKKGAAAKKTLVKDRSTVQSIVDGMIKVPERDYWLSETELTQGQWESVMGYNLSKHKGVNLPVENVSRHDCDVFLEKLNQTKEVQASQFEFCLPSHAEWAHAAMAGGPGKDCWIKPGVVGSVLDMAWLKENSANQTHDVATKSPNAWGFYDMVGNVSEWVSNVPADVHSKSSAYFQTVEESSPHKYWLNMPRDCRKDYYGVRLMARVRSVSNDGAKAENDAKADKPTSDKNAVARKLEGCDFLLNKEFKNNAKYYLCFFSASWCPPCRREMPRIAKTYAETLKADPNIELIHFSRDQNDEKALAWAKEHDVKFPVVKPEGGNPLNLHSRGIPHLFIVKADGTLVDEGHPMKLFTEERLRALKQ